MRISANALFLLYWNDGAISPSSLWEIKYWFYFLPRHARIFWIWSCQKPVREYNRQSFLRYLPLSGKYAYYLSFVLWPIIYGVFFRDEDIGVRCEGQCELEYVDCTQSCSDTNCLIDCGRTLTDCINGLNINKYFIIFIIFSRLSM